MSGLLRKCVRSAGPTSSQRFRIDLPPLNRASLQPARPARLPGRHRSSRSAPPARCPNGVRFEPAISRSMGSRSFLVRPAFGSVKMDSFCLIIRGSGAELGQAAQRVRYASVIPPWRCQPQVPLARMGFVPLRPDAAPLPLSLRSRRDFAAKRISAAASVCSGGNGSCGPGPPPDFFLSLVIFPGS